MSEGWWTIATNEPSRPTRQVDSCSNLTRPAGVPPCPPILSAEYLAAAGPEVRGHDDDHCEEHGTELPGSVVCLAGINGERTILDHG